MKLFVLAAAVVTLGSLMSEASATAGDGWIVLSRDLKAWQEPVGEWYVAANVHLDPGNDRLLTGEPGGGVLINGKDGRTQNLVTRQQWGDVEVQLEFMIPRRSNSGVKLEGVYEIQIVDSGQVAKPTGSDCGGIYPRVRQLAEQTAFPVKVSENRRYFVDQNGNPVFWLGTTQWQLFREYKVDEAKTILEKSRSHGFAFVQVMLLGVGDGTAPNVYGEKPWINNDPLTPNEAYFKNVDTVVQIARDNNLTISMTLFHQRYRKHITLKNARQWAKWLAERYKDAPNIVWSMTPEAKQEFVPILRELAVGLHEGDGGRHRVTFKPDPAPYSSSFIHSEPWLDFNSMQTWKGVKLIYPMVTKDYNLKPIKPVLMAEGAYEAGSEYGFEVTPLWIRRQAYYSYLAGGHHTYGHNDSWRVLPTWKKALDAPGAVQMGILKKIFMAQKEWWLLAADQSVFASGGRTDGDVLHLAARHQDRKWAMLYLADKASFSVNMSTISAAKVHVFWVNPKTGDTAPTEYESNSGVKTFATPEGWEDALLILEATDSPT